MALNREQILAYIHGAALPAAVVAQIVRALTDPQSEASRISESYTRYSQFSFDPDGPLFGLTNSEFKQQQTMDIRHSAALAHEGRLDEAVELRREVYERAMSRWGEAQRDTLTYLNGLAKLLYDTGRFTEARETYLRTVQARSALLGSAHSDTGISLTGLGRAEEALGNYAAAVAEHRRAVAISENENGREHPDTGVSLNDLGCALSASGSHAEAREVFERATDIYRMIDGEDDPNTAIVLGNLGGTIEALGEWEAALEIHLRVAAILEQASAHAVDLAWAQNNLGTVLHMLGDDAAAVSHFQRALEMPLGSSRFEQLTRAGLHNNLAATLEKLGDRATALQHYQQAALEFMHLFDRQHPTRQSIDKKIAFLQNYQANAGRITRCE